MQIFNSMALPLGNEERPPTTHLIRKRFCLQLASEQDGERTIWNYSELRPDLSHSPPAQPVEGITHSEGCTPSPVVLYFSFSAITKMDPILNYFSIQCPSIHQQLAVVRVITVLQMVLAMTGVFPSLHSDKSTQRERRCSLKHFQFLSIK